MFGALTIRGGGGIHYEGQGVNCTQETIFQELRLGPTHENPHPRIWVKGHAKEASKAMSQLKS